MKLILKRYGDDPKVIRKLGDYRHPSVISDHRPFALHTEDGEVLPCQVSTSMNSAPGSASTVTVVFHLDGLGVVVQGDR